MALLSKMFSLAIKWRMRTDNPCRGVERNPENKRTRYLSGAEMAKLTQALAVYHDEQAANIIRLLLLAGARRGEVLAMRWEHLDLASGVWVKPGATTKQKTEHRAPCRHQRVSFSPNSLSRVLLSSLVAKATATTLRMRGLTSARRQALRVRACMI